MPRPKTLKERQVVRICRIPESKNKLLRVKLAQIEKSFAQFVREAVDKFLSY